MAADFPQEILVEIFARSSAKSVGRFRALSKLWNAHLSATSFIKKHLISSQEKKETHLAIVTSEEDVYTIGPRNELKILPGEWCSIIGSCNGLLLLDYMNCFDLRTKKLMLVNPVTDKQVVFKPRPFTDHGLGYDSCSDDYKIVQVDHNRMLRGGPTLVDVYSVKNGVWKRVDGCYPYGKLHLLNYGFEGGAFLNGAVHWIVGWDLYRSCITAFDLSTEVFSDIPLPKEFVRQLRKDAESKELGRRRCGVSVIGGCLSIIDNYVNNDTDLWIMKEYRVAESWVRFRITNGKGEGSWIAAVLSYVRHAELLCLTNSSCFVVCDLKEGTMREVSVAGFDNNVRHGMTFVDTLVSPESSMKF